MVLEPTPISPAVAQSALEDVFGEVPNEKPELPLFMGLLRQHQAHFIAEHLRDYLDPEIDKHAKVQAAYADRFVLNTDDDVHRTTLDELGFNPNPLQEAVVKAHREAAVEHYEEVKADTYPVVLKLPKWGN